VQQEYTIGLRLLIVGTSWEVFSIPLPNLPPLWSLFLLNQKNFWNSHLWVKRTPHWNENVMSFFFNRNISIKTKFLFVWMEILAINNIFRTNIEWKCNFFFHANYQSVGSVLENESSAKSDMFPIRRPQQKKTLIYEGAFQFQRFRKFAYLFLRVWKNDCEMIKKNCRTRIW